MSNRRRGISRGQGRRQANTSPKPTLEPTPGPALPPQPESLNTCISRLEQMFVELLANHNRVQTTAPLVAPPPPPQDTTPLVPPQPEQPPQQPQPPLQLVQPAPAPIRQGPIAACDVKLLIQFKKLDPPKFNGQKDLIMAENWVNGVEKLFAYMQCTETEKVGLATFFLIDEAKHWWTSTETILKARHPTITWDFFLEAFNKKYLPLIARQKLQAEFLGLTQGSMSVDEYESKFTALSRFDPETMHSEEYKVHMFMEGLRPAIRAKLAPFDIVTYDEALCRAQLCELDYDLHQVDFGVQAKGKGKEKVKRRKDEMTSSNKPLIKKTKVEGPVKAFGIKILDDKATKSTVIDSPTGFQIGMSTKCAYCGRAHGNKPCYWMTGACFGCGEKGHQVKDCPNNKLKAKEPEKTPQPSRRATPTEKGKQVVSHGLVYAIDKETAYTSSDMIKDYLQ